MKGQTNHSILGNSLQRKLRNTMTDAEIRLWRRLRGRQIAGCKFRRQHPFMDYVVDFVCLEMQLIVEVDGGQHLECEQDQVRDRRLQEAGFRVLRFWNNRVLQEIDSVVEVIWSALQEESGRIHASFLPHPHPRPPLEGEGEDRARGADRRRPHPRTPLEGEGEGNDSAVTNPSALPQPSLEREGEGDAGRSIEEDR